MRGEGHYPSYYLCYCEETIWVKVIWERKCLAFTSSLHPIIEKCQDLKSNRAESWRQKLIERPERGSADWLIHQGLLSLLSSRNQPRYDTPTMGLALSQKSLIKNMPYGHIVWRYISTEVSSFPIILICGNFIYTSQHNHLTKSSFELLYRADTL